MTVLLTIHQAPKNYQYMSLQANRSWDSSLGRQAKPNQADFETWKTIFPGTLLVFCTPYVRIFQGNEYMYMYACLSYFKTSQFGYHMHEDFYVSVLPNRQIFVIEIFSKECKIYKNKGVPICVRPLLSDRYPDIALKRELPSIFHGSKCVFFNLVDVF